MITLECLSSRDEGSTHNIKNILILTISLHALKYC